jgi:hypothetical protein
MTDTPDKPRKAPGRPFQPGQSGNPGGRKPMPEELKAAMRGQADTAVKVLEKAMLESLEEGKPSTRAGILAANAVLDRGYGKATQPIVAEGTDLGAAHLEAMRLIMREDGVGGRGPTAPAPIATPEPVKPATPVALTDDGEKPPPDRIN